MGVNSENDIVTLIACDKEKVMVESRALEKSVTLSQLYGNIPMENLEIPLDKITSKTLRQVARWLTRSYNMDLTSKLEVKEGQKTPELPLWDKSFFAELNNTELLALIQAAEYLQIEELLEMGCRVIAQKLREANTIQEIREQWNVDPGWTKAEECQIKRDLRWCYE